MTSEDERHPPSCRLIEAAIPIIGGGGIRGTALRKVANRSGLPLSTITNEIGSKHDLIRAALEEVVRRDLTRLEARIEEVCAASPDLLLAYHLLWSLVEDGWSQHRTEVLALFELLLKAGSSPDLENLCLGWLRDRRDLLRKVAGRLDIAHVAIDVLGLQLLTEAGFAIACGRSLVYRMIAAEDLREAMACMVDLPRIERPAGPNSSAGRFYDSTFVQAGNGGPTDETTAARTQMVEAAADLIQEQGIDQVSHRSVAAKTGASSSLAAYYFKTVDELVAAGLRRLFERLEPEIADLKAGAGSVFARGREDGRVSTIEELSGRGIMALSLAVARNTAPCALGLELRRQRGLVTFSALRRVSGTSGSIRSRAASHSLWVTGAFLVLAVGRDARELYDLDAMTELAGARLLS
jgi:DNA-binding transcriptional regulator YbjK